tara:strand:- start:725 stop:961 length:237 start_codon:yes stop_codon:yes gene_type:complete
MIKSSVEKLAQEIGFDIAMSDDETQAKLLNGFCGGLANSMQDHNLQTQLCYIVNKLDEKSMKVLKDLVGFIDLKQSKP